MDLDYKKIGVRVRAERKALNLSREKFAEIIDLSVNYVGQIERGEKRFSVDTICRISECLHSSLDYLIKGVDLPITNKDVSELSYLLDKCSKYEANLITDVVKVLIPRIKE